MRDENSDMQHGNGRFIFSDRRILGVFNIDELHGEMIIFHTSSFGTQLVSLIRLLAGGPSLSSLQQSSSLSPLFLSFLALVLPLFALVSQDTTSLQHQDDF